jgi:phosphatidylserine decarboxylase
MPNVTRQKGGQRRIKIYEETAQEHAHPYLFDSQLLLHFAGKRCITIFIPRSLNLRTDMYQPIVQELVDKMEAEPRMKEAMQEAFTLAYATGVVQFKEYNVHNVDDYMRYMNDFLHWVPTENSSGRNVYFHSCMFYFIIDMPPIRDWQSPIDPDSKAPWRWLSDWLIRYAQQVGLWMDNPDSITAESLLSFYQNKSYRMQDYIYPPGGWKTFNEFFARHIEPDKRQIGSPSDDSIIVSPADCTFDGTWEINEFTADVEKFDVKGIPWTIKKLLADDGLGAAFAGGVFTHSFLNANDYHRQHAPVAGTVIEAKVIPGICYLEVIVHTPATLHSGMGLDMNRYLAPANSKNIPSQDRGLSLPMLAQIGDLGSLFANFVPPPDLLMKDRPGYQFLQARGLILIDNPLLGLVAVLPVGMAQISSVVLSVKPGDTVTKGQEISYFQFGGSDVIMVFQKRAKVKFDQKIGEHYNFGTPVATGGTPN